MPSFRHFPHPSRRASLRDGVPRAFVMWVTRARAWPGPATGQSRRDPVTRALHLPVRSSPGLVSDPLASARARRRGQRPGRCLAAIASAFQNSLSFSASRSSLRNVRRRVSPDAVPERRHVCCGQQRARRLHLSLSPGECASPAEGVCSLPCRL